MIFIPAMFSPLQATCINQSYFQTEFVKQLICFLSNSMRTQNSSFCCLSSSFCIRVSTQSAISGAVKQTGTSVIVACGLAEHSNGKAACPHLCLCVSKVHLSSSPCLRVCMRVLSLRTYIVSVSHFV